MGNPLKSDDSLEYVRRAPSRANDATRLTVVDRKTIPQLAKLPESQAPFFTRIRGASKYRCRLKDMVA